jgi:high affinity sulfate transporter 1
VRRHIEWNIQPDRNSDVSTALRQVPILGWIREYQRQWIARDVIAGLTVWGLIIPEGMAYAGLAGLPPQAGLYTVLVSMLAYAVFGTSRHLIVAATSATAALLGATVATMHIGNGATLTGNAEALVLLVGGLFVVAGLARLGFVAQFLSRPVMEGFVVGLAIFVAVGQMNKLFGVSKGKGDTFEKFWHVITQLGQANWWAFAIGAFALVALFVLPHVSKKLPAGLVVLAAAIAISAAMDLAGAHAVDVVGVLPKGLPSITLPHITLSSLWTLVPAAVGIVLVAYSEALGVAESFAARHGYEIRPNQELIAYGVANLASGLVGGLTACGGMSPSAVNDGAGAKSQVSGLAATAAALITVIALTPLFKTLPEAVLAALIIHAVSHMMSVAKLKAVFRLSPVEFWFGILALVGVLAFDVLQGLLIAMGVSLLLVVYRSSRPSLAVLGQLPDAPNSYAAIDRHPGARSHDGVLILRLDAPLYYANASSNRDAIKEAVVNAATPVRAVIFDPEVQHRFDVTSVEMVEGLVDWLRQRHVDIYITNLHADLLDEVERAGLVDLIGADHITRDIAEAVARTRA